MELQDLVVFRTVAKHGNISKAAIDLNFVQSSVTSKVKKLETHFQTQLFHRHRYGVTLTSAGKTLLEYSEQILHLFNEAEKTIMYAEIPTGFITIGSMETTAAVRLPFPLAMFNNTYPEVTLSLKTGPTAELVEGVLAYDLDGAFVASSAQYQDLVYEQVFEEELVLISKNKQPITIADLKNSNLLVFKQGCSYRRLLEEWLISENIMPNKMMEFGSLEAIIGCVNAGLGISLLPKSVITRYQDYYSLACHELPKQFAKVHTFFIYRQDVVKTLALQKFIETVRDFYLQD